MKRQRNVHAQYIAYIATLPIGVGALPFREWKAAQIQY